MTATTALGLALALAVGFALGWLLHAARSTGAQATLAAMRDNERLLHQSVGAAGEDAARRHSTAIGQQVAALVDPLREAVGALDRHVAQVESTRAQAYAGLREQVAGMHRTSQLLSTQTTQLVTALRAPQIRGRWGEIQLERVVELAGMVRHCDFDTQVTRDGARPDLVVYLAGGKQIVVDAKVPFAAFLDAAQDEDPQSRESHLVRHARQLRKHIDQLADKAYWELFDPTPEFVVLFLPGDAFLDAALTTDADLLEHAFARNVILATPTTLIALLRTIAHTWRQEALSRDAATIHQLGRELYSRLGTAGTHLDRLGAQLGKAVDSFNHTVASMESRVLVTARKLDELELYDGESKEVSQVESWPRAVGMSNISSTSGHAKDVF
ncbi:DNA recombination protein RmuC [Antrihabitans cavernicola]|uniref:DNA recombination protein RmuC n=1 Tax=Antrihabitans cavernicola TaxID=2495913 RepID=A0A5A7SI74_9NOCA|nr:DNA recombination protein RmuC [Spelaeibacter cavernicola]KAA0023931.1 DNA recombination protein RmuC [Spelaeibacter cavernicola]